MFNGNIKISGLKQVLRRFDENGRYAKSGSWVIANGGYDLWWELYYDRIPVVDCVDGEIENCCLNPKDYARIAKIITEIYPDIKVEEDPMMDDDIEACGDIKASKKINAFTSYYVSEKDMDDWKQIAKAYAKKHNAELLFVNDTSFGVEYPDGSLHHIRVEDLAGLLGADIDACDDIKATTNTSSIVNTIYSVMMDYEYGYDPDMTDINSLLQALTSKGVHVDNSNAFKKAWVSAHNKAERKTWGRSGDSMHYDSLTPRELDAIENYDTEYWEYVKDHPLDIKPAKIKMYPDDPDDEDVEGCINCSTNTKYFANMVSASTSNSTALDAIRDYIDDAGAYAEILDFWETRDGVYALIDEFGAIYVLRYLDGHIYNVNNEDCEQASKDALE